MSSAVEILRINPGSDGDGRKWPKHHYNRNDDYFLERIAQLWARDLSGGARTGATYKLDCMPDGYAGFEKQRQGTKHIDRYVYGHPNGQFRSLNEFYPHFKHLMDFGGPTGCECKQCKGGDGKKRTGDNQARTSRQVVNSASKSYGSAVPKDQLISPFKSRHQTSETANAKKRKLVDVEDVQDIYETMIQKLKAAGPESSIDEPIREQMSPDWRTSHSMSKDLLQEWRQLPRYVPRVGEVVLFVRKLKDNEIIAWNEDTEAFGLKSLDSKDAWLDQPSWEAGIVTQMPREPVSDSDLISDEDKEQAVIDSGFRVEPLSEIGSEHKPFSKQHKYISMRAIRPFTLWSECLTNVPEEDWHPSIHHALTVTSSFCVVGRYRFKGEWPDATVFSRGVYVGPELIMVGDPIRLLPRKSEQTMDAVTDVMVVTAIRLRFVNLNMSEDDMTPMPLDVPYQTCLHISGRIYTQDPTRSYDGVGKLPIDPHSDVLPSGLDAYGPWYHYSDPTETNARVELPYSRIMGRCFEGTAMKAWFGSQSTEDTSTDNTEDYVDVSRGLEGIVQARNYSMQKDKRIKSQEGKTWFWADTRIEQLDLHEVNSQGVGAKDDSRTKGQMKKWSSSLKAIDGKKGAVEEFQAAKREKEKQEHVKAQSAYGMVAASAQVGTEESDVDVEVAGVGGDSNGELMDMGADGASGESPRREEASAPRQTEPIALSDSDDEDDVETNQLAEKLAMNFRSNDPKMGR